MDLKSDGHAVGSDSKTSHSTRFRSAPLVDLLTNGRRGRAASKSQAFPQRAIRQAKTNHRFIRSYGSESRVADSKKDDVDECSKKPARLGRPRKRRAKPTEKSKGVDASKGPVSKKIKLTSSSESKSDSSSNSSENGDWGSQNGKEMDVVGRTRRDWGLHEVDAIGRNRPPFASTLLYYGPVQAGVRPDKVAVPPRNWVIKRWPLKSARRRADIEVHEKIRANPHRHLVEIVSVHANDGVLMEYCCDGDLQTLMATGRRKYTPLATIANQVVSVFELL